MQLQLLVLALGATGLASANIEARQAGGTVDGHLGPAEGTLGGDLNNGEPYGFGGGDIGGTGTTITLAARAAETTSSQQIGGGIAGTLGPLEGTAGGAIDGPTGFVQGCLGGAVGGVGTTACFPVATPPAPTETATVDGGNAAGTLGPASGFLSYPWLCGGAAVGNDGFTTCLVPTATS
ncbi:hypothetical protein PRZ48_011427 [Zasmidium cellare]|uniref:CBM1 domain-containing protein n=1 Tax=Zasmidium cellare TaxID=395010 RepID=A0ABR0E7A9_ZASCE|nr:hypothetical protein PRZ48_011427 [Zasmidium cellare]